MSQRTLTEPEFNAIRDRLLAEAPDGLDEASFQRWVGPRLAAAIGEAESKSAPPDGSALGRFAANAGEVLNPLAAAKGVWNAVRHPIDTGKAIYDASAAQVSKAADAARDGRYVEAVGHGAGAIPLIGPAAVAAGEQIADGDIAGGLGKGIGLLVPVGASAALRTAGGTARAAVPTGLRATVAESLDARAAGKVGDVMSPKVGANKTRFANRADAIAPDVVKDMAAGTTPAAWSRQGFHGHVQAKLADAAAALDAAQDARLSARTFNTKPIVEALLEKRKALTAQAVEADQPIPTLSGAAGRPQPSGLVRDIDSGQMRPAPEKTGRPVGRDVIPAPNRPHVAQIDQAIKEIETLGPVARYEDLRRIRAAYDGPAKAVYNPSLTQDFMTAQGGKMGAADVTGTLREHLAKMDPATAKANAQYSLYKTADTVLEAVAEVERARPAVGRRIISRLTGVILGQNAAGPAGAAAGFVAGPVIESVASSGWTTQLKSAHLMAKLAQAIRKGDEGMVASTTFQLKQLSAQAATLTGIATSPSGFHTAPEGGR